MKVSEKLGNFTFGYTSGFGRRFLGSKGVVISKNSRKGIYFLCSIAGFIAQALSINRMVREMSGILFLS